MVHGQKKVGNNALDSYAESTLFFKTTAKTIHYENLIHSQLKQQN